MSILVTGGAGYIGSHTVLCLLERGYNVVVLDNLSNSSYESLRRVQAITQRDIVYYQGDITDRIFLGKIFSENTIEAVIHFAGLKSVSESIKYPTKYYENNVMGSIILLEEMMKHGIYKLILVHRQPFTVNQSVSLLQKIAKQAVLLIPMVRQNLWLSRFYRIQPKRNRN